VMGGVGVVGVYAELWQPIAITATGTQPKRSFLTTQQAT
jgi:hypothetical protein